MKSAFAIASADKSCSTVSAR